MDYNRKEENQVYCLVLYLNEVDGVAGESDHPCE